MPSYIALLKWTEQGVSKVKDSPSRLDAGRKAFKKIGVEIKDTYLTMGRYDLVCLIGLPFTNGSIVLADDAQRFDDEGFVVFCYLQACHSFLLCRGAVGTTSR